MTELGNAVSTGGSAQEEVAARTVALMSCIIPSCFPVSPGPVGMTIAPRLSAPA